MYEIIIHYGLDLSMIQGISVFLFESLRACSHKEQGAEAPADLDKPTCTPSSKIAHDEVIAIHRRREEQLELQQ